MTSSKDILSKKILQKSGIVYAVLIFGLLFALTANAIAAAFLEGRIYPNVKVAGQDVSLMTRKEALSLLKDKKINYKLKVNIADKTFDLTTADFGANYDPEKTAEAIYQVGRDNFSVVGLYDSWKNGQNGYAYELDNQKFNATAQQIVNSLGRPPVNATLKINEGNIEVVPPQPGLKVDPKLLRQAISDTFRLATDQNLNFKPVETPADIQPQDTTDAQNKAKTYLSKKIELNYNGKIFTPSPSDIGHWLVFEPAYGQDKSRPYLDVRVDEAQIHSYVQGVANQINISPVNKKIIVANGVRSTEREGREGLAIDQETASNAIVQAMNANQDLSFGITASKVAYKTEYNEVVALGYPKYIEVNLSSQRLWAYQDGQVVYASPLTSGYYKTPTATGLFSIYHKGRNTYLDGRPLGYDYNVFVQYWMPFYQGYGLHDAGWRSSFGGSDYYYNGSHGCVNLPLATAQFIYGWAEIGTPVWVHR